MIFEISIFSKNNISLLGRGVHRGGAKGAMAPPRADFGGGMAPPKISRLRNFLNFNRNNLIQCRVITVKFSGQLTVDYRSLEPDS